MRLGPNFVLLNQDFTPSMRIVRASTPTVKLHASGSDGEGSGGVAAGCLGECWAASASRQRAATAGGLQA